MAAKVKTVFFLHKVILVLLNLCVISLLGSNGSQTFPANRWLADFRKARAILHFLGKTKHPSFYVRRLEIISEAIYFKMTLYRSSLADNIVLSVNGENTDLDLSTLGVYDGSVLDPCCGHKALVKVTHEGIDAIINTANNTYVIEPWSRFEQSERPSDLTNETKEDSPHGGSMPANTEMDCILYTARDVLMNNTKTDAAYAGNLIGDLIATKSVPTERSQRVRRSFSKTECAIHVVADDTFFTKVGHANMMTTFSEMMYFVREADAIFRGTDFNGDGLGDNIGFYVTKMSIRTNSSQHFMKDSSSASDYLYAFSKYNFDDFCLGVAFTSNGFANGVIGLAWVASSSEYGQPGGICQKRVFVDPHIYSLNTGIVTSHNAGNRMPTYKTVITLAHEFGHNFGSPHDSKGDAGCAPDGDYGNFLMYPYATDGTLPNNKIFSSCSIGYIYPVLRNKGSCLTAREETRSVCGNGIVEDEEDCDCGSKEACSEIDSCCTPDDVDPSSSDVPCKLRTSQGSECSPIVSPCCSIECRILPVSEKKQCRGERDCTAPQLCDGISAECPDVVNNPNGTECDGGTKTCMDGSCTGNICTIHGKTQCSCSGQYSCFMCCHSSLSPTCEPTTNHAGQRIHRLLGQSCEDRKGYCDGKGKCIIKDSSNTLDRIHDAFTEESVESFKKILELYWYYWVAAIVALTFMIAVFVLTCRGDGDVHTSAYMHGQFCRIQREAEIQKEYLVRRKAETKEFYDEQLRNPDSSREMSATQAVARLMTFFPTATIDIIMQTLETSVNEEAAVRLMILRNYPFRRVCRK